MMTHHFVFRKKKSYFRALLTALTVFIFCVLLHPAILSVNSLPSSAAVRISNRAATPAPEPLPGEDYDADENDDDVPISPRSLDSFGRNEQSINALQASVLHGRLVLVATASDGRTVVVVSHIPRHPRPVLVRPPAHPGANLPAHVVDTAPGRGSVRVVFSGIFADAQHILQVVRNRAGRRFCAHGADHSARGIAASVREIMDSFHRVGDTDGSGGGGGDSGRPGRPFGVQVTVIGTWEGAAGTEIVRVGPSGACEVFPSGRRGTYLAMGKGQERGEELLAERLSRGGTPEVVRDLCLEIISEVVAEEGGYDGEDSDMGEIVWEFLTPSTSNGVMGADVESEKTFGTISLKRKTHTSSLESSI